LNVIAKKYEVDPSRVREYLKGGPDPEAAQVAKKLTKATEVRNAAKVKCERVSEKFKDIAEKKRQLTLKLKEKKEALWGKMKAAQQLMERGLKQNREHSFDREDSRVLSTLSVTAIRVEKYLSNYVPSTPAPNMHMPGSSPNRPKGLPVGMKIVSSSAT